METERPAGALTTASSKRAEWLMIAAPGVIWGASFLFIAEALRAIAPNGVTFVRIAIGFSTLSLFPSARKPVLRSDWGRIFWLGVLWLAFPLSMFPFAERNLSSALTGMLNGANPLFTAAVASVIAHRWPSRPILAGLGVGLSGAILIAIPGLGAGRNSAAGMGMIVAALVSYGIALNLASPLQRRNGALPVIWRAQMVALLLTSPLGLRDVMAARWTTGPLLALLALGALGTGVAYVAMSVAAGRLGAARASAITFVIPAVALALGVVVLKERVSAVAVTGGALCVTGAWLMRRERRPTRDVAGSDRTEREQGLRSGNPYPAVVEECE